MAKRWLSLGPGERYAASLFATLSCLQMYDTTLLLRGVNEGFVDIRKDLFIFLLSFTIWQTLYAA